MDSPRSSPPSRGRLAAALLAPFGLLVAGAAEAYPIPPAPLWTLVEQATVIVVAEVAAVMEPELPDPQPDLGDASQEWVEPRPHRAVLRVSEVWKGEAGSELVVPYPGFLICPAPPAYLEGERVLAFLAADGEGELTTVALSYGTLYPAEPELADFREMVASALRLQARPKVALEARRAWAVEAAARPGTRWHGLYELHPRGDEVHSFYDRGEERPLARARLTPAQLDLLARSFETAPSTDQTAVMMLGVLAGWESESLDRAAVSVVEALLAQEAPAWWLRDLLVLALARYGESDSERRLAKLGDRFDYGIDAARELWQRARRELAIPEVAPAPLRLPRAPGVGERTPS